MVDKTWLKGQVYVCLYTRSLHNAWLQRSSHCCSLLPLWRVTVLHSLRTKGFDNGCLPPCIEPAIFVPASDQHASKADNAKYRTPSIPKRAAVQHSCALAGTLFIMADPSLRDDELALTLDHRCYRLAVHDDDTYCSNFASIIEGIIRSIPETTSDVMESTAAARRSYVTALPAPDQPAPRDFDESRSVPVQRI